MNQVEDALIRRIDARRAFAGVLATQSQRNRAILVGCWRDGWTVAEISKSFGISVARVNQVCAKGLRRVQHALKEPPPEFDKAAFLEHQRQLIQRRALERETVRKTEWQRELGVMAHFLDLATPPKPPAPEASPTWRIRLPVQYTVHVPPSRPYVPPPPPVSAVDLAQQALVSFMGFRQPTEGGCYDVGARCSTVSFTMNHPPTPAEIDESMRRMAAEIPADAVLSCAYLGNTAATQMMASVRNRAVAVQALVQWHNPSNGVAGYRLAITWDFPADGTA